MKTLTELCIDIAEILGSVIDKVEGMVEPEMEGALAKESASGKLGELNRRLDDLAEQASYLARLVAKAEEGL